MSKKAINFGIVLIVVGIVILSAVGVFYFSRDKITKEIKETSIEIPIEIQEPGLEISELKLCSYIDERFKCEENINGDYEPISFVDMLIIVEGLKAEKSGNEYKISYIQSREIISPNNEILESGVVIDKEDIVAQEGFYPLSIKNDFFIFDNAKPGDYLIKINVIDKNSRKSVSKSKGFRVK